MKLTPRPNLTRLLGLAIAWLALTHPVQTRTEETACPCSLFGTTVPAIADAGPDNPVEVGVKFIPAESGQVTAIRFYKAALNTGIHVGKLWDVDGNLLAAITFENETPSGWQEAPLSTPLQVLAGQTYLVSYRAPLGHYSFTPDFFTSPHVSGPLTAPQDSLARNGIFSYDGAFPRSSYRASNYWVDVVFHPATQTVPQVTSALPRPDATNASPPVTASFSMDMTPSSVVLTLRRLDGSPVSGSAFYDASSRTVRFTPDAALLGLATYVARVEGSSAAAVALAEPFEWRFTTGGVGFRDTVVMSGLQSPTSIRFAPGGEIFVAEKSGIVKVFEHFNDTTPTMFVDLRTQVYNYWDRGLLGLALHPDFPTQPYVYVAYAHDALIGGVAPRYGTPGTTWDSCPGSSTDGCAVSARVSRLTAVPAAGGYQMTGSEHVLVEGWGQQFPSHSIGALDFGADGALYVTGGEGASYKSVDYGQLGNPPNQLGDTPVLPGEMQTAPSAEGGALRSQSLLRTAGGPVLLNGMVLRIDPVTGVGLADNPLAGSDDANARRVIASGLRNPYRFAIRPGTNEVWVGDVGWEDVEEINRIPAPAARVLNFGWPCYEGESRQHAYEAAGLAICQSLYASVGAVEPPVFQYKHWEQVTEGEGCGTGSSAVSGLAFYAGGAYPAAYAGALFFSDYARGCVWAALPDSAGGIDFSRRVSVLAGAVTPVELRTGPGGDVYYVDLNGGRIHRIEYLGEGAARAHVTATPLSGQAPLTVHFDGGSSIGSGLSYRWDFGDGGDEVSGGPTIAHTYQAGNHSARLTVTDSSGTTDATSVAISVTSPAPVPVIDTPSAALPWSVGDALDFSGHASDPVDGVIPPAQLSWALVMYHCSSATTCHTHTIQDFAGVASGSFMAPDHDYPSYMTLTLTARNSRGVTGTTTVRLDPRVITMRFVTEPSGLSLAVGSATVLAPHEKTSIVGSFTSASAPATQTLNGVRYDFVRWSDGGAASHEVVAPATDVTYTAIYARAAAPASTLFGGAVPATVDAGADSPVELGLKFRADINGTITGVRFYKSAANTGPHVGSLWTAAGARLAFVTFTAETASGWQEARFASPVQVSAGTVYVVSYHTTRGHYAHTASFFAAQYDAGVLHAPAGANGVFRYGAAGSFPAGSYRSANYWVDVLFTSTPDTTAPTIVAQAPAAGAIDVACSASVRVGFSEALNPASVVPGTISLTDPSGAPIAGSAVYDGASRTVLFTPAAALSQQTLYSVRVAGGTSASAPRDVAGNAVAAEVSWSFRTASVAPPQTGTLSLFPATLVPATIDAGPDSPVELGVKFRSATAGTVVGVRFYKSAANTGAHVGSLWAANGTRLAQVSFAAETASGWQEALFPAPVTIAAGTTYVVSYHTTGGHYSVTPGFFNAAYDRAPLSAPATSVEANGVFKYGAAAGQFPASTYNGANYWVDVAFVPAGPDTTAPMVTTVSPANGTTGVALNQATTATFSEAMDAASVSGASFVMRDASGATVPGTVTYDAATKTARFITSSALLAGSTYTVRISGSPNAAAVRDVAGNPLAADATFSFTTLEPSADGCPCTLFGSSLVPAVIDVGPDNSVELGVRFRADENGYIRGIRFFKGAGNVGPHEVSLWTGTGSLITRTTSVSESASGWQEVTFQTPVAITAGTVYVASYHVNAGHYSYTAGYFNNGFDAAPLHAVSGANGVYAYGHLSLFPTSTYNSANYWVDVVFTRQP